MSGPPTYRPADEPAAPAQPAATVLVVRDAARSSASTSIGSSHRIEVLLLERSAVGAFAGMWVFPGGRVDDHDAGDDEIERARSAAVREAAEEAGITIERARLHTFSHWVPPANTPNRRFSTWFFATTAGSGASCGATVTDADGDLDGGVDVDLDVTVTVDGHEIVDHRWIAPAEAIDARLPMAPPTFVTLHQLAAFGSVADLEAAMPDWSVGRFHTRPATTASGDTVLLWEGDAGYETFDGDLPGARHRVVWPAAGPYVYVRHP